MRNPRIETGARNYSEPSRVWRTTAMPKSNAELCNEVEAANRRGAAVTLPPSEPDPARERPSLLGEPRPQPKAPDLPLGGGERSRWPKP